MHGIRVRLIGLALCALVLGCARLAHAEELGTRQNLVLSAEDLFGFYIDNQTVERAGRDDSVHHTLLGVGWAPAPSPLTTPKLGIDYFLTHALTLGGNLGFFSSTDAGNTSIGVLLAARVGYAVRLGHSVSLWPRAGLSFSTISRENGPDSNLLALVLDVPFTFALVEGFAITAGPTLALGFVGKTAGNSYSEIWFGLMIGLAGWTGL